MTEHPKCLYDEENAQSRWTVWGYVPSTRPCWGLVEPVATYFSDFQGTQYEHLCEGHRSCRLMQGSGSMMFQRVDNPEQYYVEQT